MPTNTGNPSANTCLNEHFMSIWIGINPEYAAFVLPFSKILSFATRWCVLPCHCLCHWHQGFLLFLFWNTMLTRACDYLLCLSRVPVEYTLCYYYVEIQFRFSVHILSYCLMCRMSQQFFKINKVVICSVFSVTAATQSGPE